ncbi:Fis family transcriptional regulator [Brasilonema sp. CT11]|nr:Fis family transcriptional regulator [Brasilonema sp. CT11]
MEITIVSVASTLIFKALEKSGEKLGEVLLEKIGELRNLVREKFKSKGVEGILMQAEKNPTEANKQMFQTVLEMQVSQDEIFANDLRALVDELKSNSQVNQIFLKDVDVLGSAEIGDVRQITTSGSSVNQEAATNLKLGGNLKIGNVKQQN